MTQDILTKIENLQENNEYSVGNIISPIPEGLKKIINLKKFFGTKQLSGIYIIYFPYNETVYIGQSVNITREVSMLRGGFRGQPLVNKAFKESGGKAVAFSILQGPGLKDKKLRLDLEKKIIQQAGDKCINIIGNDERKTSELLNNTSIKRAVFHPLEGIWQQYNLNYPNLKPKTGEGCIYLYCNIGTGKFYIGESADFVTNTNKVLKRHRAAIAQNQSLFLQNQTVKCSAAIINMVKDILEDGVNFAYSVIEHTGILSPEDRKKKELEYRVKALQLYGDRLYNPPSVLATANSKKRTQESKNISKMATLIQNKKGIKIDTTRFPCIIDGVWYDTMAEVGRALGLTVKGTLKRRLLSPSFPTYIWLKDTVNKQIPTSKEIQEKLKNYYKSL